MSEGFEREDSNTGRRFGPFRAVRLLGRGGMGSVYLGQRDDGQFEQQVAIKVFAASVVGEAGEERFRRERRFWRRSSIRRLRGCSMAALPGRHSLPGNGICRRARAARPLPRHEAPDRREAAPVPANCRCRRYAHQNLIIHRDLKPDNILVTADGGPKLLDFGTGKILDAVGSTDAEATRWQAFTPQYASPEQVLGLPASISCDIYSLGVLLYELLTGSLPYEFGTVSTEEIVATVCRR